MTLKTLKDMGRFQFDEPEGICPEELRQEAIKHIEHLKIIEDKDCDQLNSTYGSCYEEDLCVSCKESDEATYQIDWIRYFFNIKEEELS